MNVSLCAGVCEWVLMWVIVHTFFSAESECMFVFYLIPPEDLWEARENNRGKVGIMRQRNESEQGGIVL